MRVIKNGSAGKKSGKCYHCGSLIEYEDSELSEGIGYDPSLDMGIWSKYLFCPVCKRKLIVNEVPIK